MSHTHTPAQLAHIAKTRPPPAWQIERAMVLARATAARWPTQVSEGIDGDDLRAAAMLEAWRALLTYDPARGATLDSWIIYGCRRGVLEALREADPLTRTERKKLRRAEAEYAEAVERNDPGTPPGPAPTPPRLMVSLEDILHRDEENDRNIKWLDLLGCPDPESVTLPERMDTERMVAVALYSLEDRHHYVVTEWMAGLTFKRIAQALKTSESRVHQIWKESLQAMRMALAVGARREARRAQG